MQGRGGAAAVTTDPEEIRRWVEERGGKPACVKGTRAGNSCLLRIDFPDGPEPNLEQISWDEFFNQFQKNDLAFLYQDKKQSRFNKLVSRETAQAKGEGNRKTSGKQSGRGSASAGSRSSSSRSESRSRSAKTESRPAKTTAKRGGSKSASARSSSGTSRASGQKTTARKGSSGRAGSRASSGAPSRSNSGSRSRNQASAAGNRRASQVTTDHDEIRRWAEERGGQPACVTGTGNRRDTGLLRFDFGERDPKLQPISWEDFFQKFDENNLALLYQAETAGGAESRFNKLVSRETAQQRPRTRSAGSSRTQ